MFVKSAKLNSWFSGVSMDLGGCALEDFRGLGRLLIEATIMSSFGSGHLGGTISASDRGRNRFWSFVEPVFDGWDECLEERLQGLGRS